MNKNNFRVLLFKEEQEPRGTITQRTQFNIRNNILIIRALQQCNGLPEKAVRKKCYKEILTIPGKIGRNDLYTLF